MGIDNLVTIGIIIYVIYSIKKVISGGKKNDNTAAGQGKKKGGWADKLGDFITEVKNEIENANQTPTQQPVANQQSDDFFWDEVREAVPPQQTVPFEHGNDFTRASDNEERIIEIPPVPEEDHRNYHGSHDKPGKVYDGLKPKRSTLRMRRCDLKQAIVWSEILSKPIGLRE